MDAVHPGGYAIVLLTASQEQVEEQLAPDALTSARLAWQTLHRDGIASLARKIIQRVGPLAQAKRRAKDLVARATAEFPAVSVRVAVYSSWDIDPAIQYLTVGGSGSWGPVYFGRGPAVPDPDFILILNSPANNLRVTIPPERLWFAVGEPPDFKPYHAAQGRGTVLLTCDASVLNRSRREYEVILTHPVLRTWHVRRSIEELAELGDLDKPKLLSWVTTNKEILSGHKVRMQFLRSIQGRIPFDLFGHGFKPLSDKWDGIAPYRYSIAFENSRSSHYFTEKIMDCFVCSTMPIYYGSSEIHKYFPHNSFVELDPDDPYIVYKLGDLIQSDLWKEAQGALQEAKWLVLYKYNMFSQLARMMLDRVGPPTAPGAIEVRTVSISREQIEGGRTLES